MSNRRILVTGVGGDIGQSVVRCIKDEGKDIVIGCDIDSYAGGKYISDKFYLSPRVANEEKYIKFIKEIILDEEITHIIPITEYEIKFFSNINCEIILPNVKVMINNNFIINTFLDKFETIEFFKDKNINYPKTFDIRKYNNELVYPLIIKDKSSRGGKGVYIVESQLEFEQVISKVDDAIVQEIIGNEDEEYTMAIFSDGKNVSNIAFRRKLGYGSLSKFVELVNSNELDELAKKISKEVKLIGSINIQMRKGEYGFVPFEINPRISSTVAFRNHFGFKDVIWWLEVLDKERCNIVYKPKYTKGIGVRVVQEVYFDMEK